MNKNFGFYTVQKENEKKRKKMLGKRRRKDSLSEQDMTALHECLQEFEHEVEHLSHDDKKRIIEKIEHMSELLHEYESDDTQ